MSDLIKREDAIETAYQLRRKPNDEEWEDWLRSFKAIPSADRPKEVIAQVTFDEEKLHEIVKEAVERFKEEYDVVGRPQGAWILHIDDLFPCESTQECSICHAEQLINGSDDNYCPNCGAKMKGVDDERVR